MQERLYDRPIEWKDAVVRTAALVMMSILAACSSEGDPPPVGPGRKPVSTLSISTVPDMILVGERLTLSADVKAADGETLTDRNVAWESEHPTIASISADGVLQARSPGLTIIRAESEGRVDNRPVRITAPRPVPALTLLMPDKLQAGQVGPLPMRIVGAGFTDASRVLWNGVERQTVSVSNTELEITLQTVDLATPGTVAITVRNPAPGGGESNPVTFHITPAPASAPTITSLSPAQITAGWPMGFTLTINGTGFTRATVIYWNGEPRETEYVGATAVRMRVDPTDVRVAHDIQVTVETPAPGGGRASAIFPVRNIPVDRVDLQAPFGGSWMWVGGSWPLTAVPRSATGTELGDREAFWRSGDTHIALMVSTGSLSARVYGVSRGTTFVEATVDGVAVQRPVVVYDAPPYDIVYSSGTGDEQFIGLWSLATGSAPRKLPIPLMGFMPSPSPTGSHIVFAGAPKGGGFEANIDLYVVGRDGTGLRRLTTAPSIEQHPAWSPDGQRIAYSSSEGGAFNVWVMNADGSNRQQLTDARLTTPLPGSGQGAGGPAWSPDGTRLVYTVSTNGVSTLWIMNADGSAKRQLTTGANGSAFDPAWSADGQQIAFRQESTAPLQTMLAFVSALDGTQQFPVFNLFAMTATPAYSPDGNWLLASNSAGGDIATLYATPLKALGEPRIVLPASLGGARAARWIKRP